MAKDQLLKKLYIDVFRQMKIIYTFNEIAKGSSVS